MVSFRDFIVFLSGAEFFHTLVHVFLHYYEPLPLDLKITVLTPEFNNWSIIINFLITIALMWWASKLPSKR